MKFRNAVVGLVICAAALCGCNGGAGEAGNPEIVASEGCEGLVPNIYRTTGAHPVGINGNAPVFAPLQVIFMPDGVVIWNADIEGAQIGQFTCDKGELEAKFTTGNMLLFTGSYNPEANSVTINEVEYAYFQDSP